MKMKKLLKNLKSKLGLDISKKEMKHKALKELLKKLARKNKKIKQKLKEELSSKEKNELLEEKEIVQLQIKKIGKILEKIDS